MLAETQSYVAWNVWCNICTLSMFIIYGCNVCACKRIFCIVEENKSLTAEDSVVRVMPYTSWGICFGNPENFNDFYWGLLTGVFVLSRSNKTLWEKVYPVMKTLWGKAFSAGEFRSLGCMPIYWGVTLGWGETKVNCYLVDFQVSRQLDGGTWRNWINSAGDWKFPLHWGS